MGMAEPLDPDSAATPPPPAPVPDSGRADWLVGAEEGIDAELQRKAQEEAAPRPVPKLFRPGASEGVDAVAAPVPAVTPTLSRPTASFAPGGPAPAPPAKPRAAGAVTPESTTNEFSQGFALSWEAGANSVPSIRREPARSTTPAEPTRDFPMDDAEERAQARVFAEMAAAEAAERVARPHDVVAPDVFDVPAPKLPWWMQVPEALRTDRRLQLLAGLGVVLLLVIAFFPRGERGVSLGELKKRADHFDGQDVKVKGKVGEVFSVGGGYAFYLHQGRDTMVVFTRTRQPKPRQTLQIVGHVSTGYLDGRPRLALFENPANK